MAKTLDEFLDRFDEWINENGRYQSSLELFRSLNEESPRGMVLVIAAEMDRLLLEAIQKMLRDGAGQRELNEDSKGPLSSFSARINLAHALHIVTDEEWRDLHLIRKIRNDFAHVRDVSFENQTVKNRIRELSQRQRDDAPAETLERVAMYLMMHLEVAIAGLESYELPAPERIFGPDAS